MSEPKFGKMTPAEASKLGVEARQRKREEAPDLTPAQKIEAAMQKKAIGGDVNAAREYREWLKLNQATGNLHTLNEDIIGMVSDRWEQAGLDVLSALIADERDPSAIVRAAEKLAPFAGTVASRMTAKALIEEGEVDATDQGRG